MHSKPCKNMDLSQFDICKLLYTSGILSKIKLTPTSKLVLIALANHYNPNNKDMFPSQKFLANQLGLSERSITNAILELKTKSLIIYETKTVNRYRFTNIFFEQVKFAEGRGKVCGVGVEKFATKQIKEKIKQQTQNGFLNSSSKQTNVNEYKQRKYHYNTQENGIKYQAFKPLKVEKSSPLDFTYEQAQDYLNSLPEFLSNSFFAKELRKKWNL